MHCIKVLLLNGYFYFHISKIDSGFKKLSVQVHIGPAEIIRLGQIAPENLDSAKLISLATFLIVIFL